MVTLKFVQGQFYNVYILFSALLLMNFSSPVQLKSIRLSFLPVSDKI